MNEVTVSPRFQVTIPKDVREAARIHPGQKLVAMALDGRIALVPVSRPSELRGFLKGTNNSFEREHDRRCGESRREVLIEKKLHAGREDIN